MQVIFGSVDGVHFRIQEPRKQPNTNWKSHKSNGPGYSYEVALSLYDSKIIWIDGPFPAATGDLTTFCHDGGLKSKIPPGKKLMADLSYRSQRDCCAVKNELDSLEVREFKRRGRARQETFFTRIKNFAILGERFRHALEKHQSVFEASCVLMQFEMDNGYPLFDI